jgi:hypothetical protein
MTGKPPFGDKTNYAVIFEVMIKKRHPSRPDFSDSLGCEAAANTLWDLLTRCWTYAPGDRPTATQVKEAVSITEWIRGVC